MDIWQKIEDFDKKTDSFSTTVKIDPKNNTVERYVGSESPCREGTLYLDGRGKVDWPQGIDYHHEFDPAMSLYARNWKYHLEEHYKDGIPFIYQILEIVDIDEPDAIYGWALIVKVLG